MSGFLGKSDDVVAVVVIVAVDDVVRSADVVVVAQLSLSTVGVISGDELYDIQHTGSQSTNSAML